MGCCHSSVPGSQGQDWGHPELLEVILVLGTSESALYLFLLAL